MLRKNFCIYAKTFGGKIWTNLHRVSLGNFFGKNFNNASFKISCHELFKQHLVQKKCWVNANYCLALSKKIIFVLRNSESTKSISSPEFFVHNSLHEMHAKKFLTKKHHDKLKIAPKLDQLLIVFLAFVLNSD